MPTKKKDSNLPPPKYVDGGNRYIGKCKENSKLFCLLCETFGCICVHPAETEEQLKVKLEMYIENGKKNLSLNNDLGRWDYYKENIPIWEARLAKL